MNQIGSVFIASSLDGYIARTDGSIDWLNEANDLVPEGEDCGFLEFMLATDVLVMGRKTFEQVLSFEQWPYGDTPVTVLSRNIVQIPSGLKDTVSYSSESPVDLCKKLSQQGAKQVYVDGGSTIQSFLAHGLIKDLTITRIPIVIGSGIPLFGNLTNDIKLKHIATKAFDFGFVQSKYEIENEIA